MQKSHRIWLAVPHEEKDDAINAHPRLDNGQKALEWDNEHRLWYARPGADLNKFERWMPRPHELSMNAEDPVTEFSQKLEEAGLIVKGLPVMDGSLQRVPTKQDKKGSKSGAYKAYLDGRPAGWYRDYRSADAKPTQWVFSGGGEMDPLARLHLRAHAQQTREDNARALELQYNRQAEYAARYVDRYPQATTNTYLTRKGVEAAPGIRINEKQELVIPFSNAHGDIRSYQRIPLTGGKDARILKDSEKTGNWFALGTPQNGKPLLFAEGYATAASIHEASGLPVLMTIDAGNMIAVGQNARAVWPDSQFIFCADNDHQLKNPQTGEPENKGILSATKAAELTDGEVIAPAFTPTELEQNLTDFNDLILSRGKDLARHLINVQLHAMGIETPFNTNSQTRNAFVEGGLVFTPVQETAMDNHESPDIAHISDNDIVREHTVSELAEANEQNPVPTEPEQPQPADVRDEPSPTPPIEADVLIPDTQSNPDGTLVTSPDDIGQGSQSVVEAGSHPPLPDLDDYADIRAQMDDPQFGEWMHSQSDDLPHKPAQEQFTAHELLETDKQAVKPEAALHDKNAEPTAPVSSELPIPPQSPGAPLTGKKQEQAQTANADADMPELNPNWTKTADNEVNEADGLVYGPRRPEPLQREDLDKIIKALSTEEQRDNTVLYRLDGEDAFRDLGNRLEMCNGASQDKRRVLAALAVASRFYGGVVELTGSMEFKEQAMRLIIENDLDIRMKLPAQRAQLEALRQQMGTTSDSITTHIPTPDLNRQTPSPDAAPPQSSATAAPEAVSSNAPGTPTPPASPNPVSQAQEPGAPQTAFSSSTEAVTSKAADSIRVPEMPAEPAPSALKPGQSITAVLKNFGEATYENKEQKGGSFFIELQNRGGSHTYWGQDLRELIENHKTGDVVTLTLNSRDSWHVPGEENGRVKNNWSLTSASTGLAVAHDRPEQGQPLQVFPVDTFGRLTQQIRQAWPEYTTDLKLPPRLEERQFYLGEDRHPVKSPVAAASILPPSTDAPDRLIPVMASMNTQSNQLDLLLVQSAGEHLQGMVRLDGTLYPALATPTTDNSQLVINAITDDGPRFAGYGQAVNFEPDGTTRAAPQLMKFHLKGREEDTPLPARLYTPEKQADTLFQRLGFEQTWKQWDDARKPEGRQEKALHQEHSHSPGR
ncbi:MULTISPECIES: LPD7 domain-containing protein [Citrobacter freundii complex]|uniref:LPD7 domain-containing protein n=1 Tax=Citrobacter freundii complex TaxID=1344959 RepID=UPI001D0B061B|nr:LPD7 domain-containing protein [Citrobacter werkmanii]MBQ4938321.1 DNA primase [Citrobacter werkmanii]MBQ4951089.1 DNA primase [Citrobacter werkmanii]